MNFSLVELEEFKIEALDLLNEVERHLLILEKGGDFCLSYDAIFRVFHSLKGAAGMMGMDELQSHMHQLEHYYQELKFQKSISKELINYFIKGVDVAKYALDGGKISFEYTLPEVKLVQARPVIGHDNNFQNKKIIIIDDEIEICNCLSDILNESGFETRCFTSPRKALDNLAKFKPDIVLTDYKMPELNGFDVLESCTNYDPDLPVIFISAFLDKKAICEALSYGIFGVIDKPFSSTQIISICFNAAHKHQTIKLLNNTISLIYYQLASLPQPYEAKEVNEFRDGLFQQFKLLIETKRKLKNLKRSPQKLDIQK